MAAPMPLAPPVTSAILPDRAMSDGGICGSGFVHRMDDCRVTFGVRPGLSCRAGEAKMGDAPGLVALGDVASAFGRSVRTRPSWLWESRLGS